MSEAVLQAKIKAFDEFSAQFQKFQSELRKLKKAEDETTQGTDKTNKSVSSFFQTIGSLGALYAFQRGLREVMATGREFELTIKQAQAVTGDFSSTLRDLAMVSKGDKLDIFTPTQLAQAYRELGAAGATTNDIIAATPGILEFGTAAILDMDASAEAVLATAKSFNIELADSQQIVDAYTESMNRGALAGEDFKWIMGSVGAVAKMAGQDFQEILSVGSAMRDSGIQAQDAGTAIKSSLLQLINPSKEASDLMKEMGINVYDASGKMKQWSEITAEFERALGPMNEQSKNLALTTIFGSDGIRAMATSMNKGSGYLQEFTQGLKDADGATHKMAEAMSDTFDGALRRTNASLERAEVLLFEDFAKGSVGLLSVINTMLIGFNNLDENTRSLISAMIGSAGLVVAIAAVTASLRALGITAATVTGPIGLTVMAISALTGAALLYKGHQEQVNQKIRDSVKENLSQANSIEALLAKYEKLSSKTNLTEGEQEQLKKAVKDLTDAVPAAITGFDAMGVAITNIGTASDIAKQKIIELRQEAIKNAEINADIARQQLPKLKQDLEAATQLRDKFTAPPSIGPPENELKNRIYTWVATEVYENSSTDLAFKSAVKFKEAQDAWQEANKKVTEAESAIQIAEDLKAGKYSEGSDTKKDDTGKNTDKTSTQTLTSSSSSSSKEKTFSEATKKYIEDMTAALSPYKTATEAAAASVSTLGAKQEYLTALLESGKGGMETAIELESVRAQTIEGLELHQQKITEETAAYQAALQDLNARQENLNGLLDEGKISKENYTDASETLRQEIDQLTSSINSNSVAWWNDQKAILEADQAMGNVYKTLFDQHYAWIDRLSSYGVVTTEQQIAYLLQLDKTKMSTEELMTLEEKLFNLRKKWMEELRDKEIKAIEEAKEKYKEASDARIKALQDQLDALDEQNERLEEQKRLAEARNSLEEAKQKLANVQAEKNTRVLKNGAWEWVADPDAVKEAQDAVEDAETNLQETKEEIADNARRRDLQEQIEYEQEQQRLQLESYEQQIEDKEQYWKNRIELTNQKWPQLISLEQANMETFDSLVQDNIRQMLSRWETYYRRVQQIIMETGGMGAEASVAQPTASHALGGPIYSDEVARLHGGEYVLNADYVRMLGGYSGVEQLLAVIKELFAGGSAGSQAERVTENIDRSLKFYGNLSFPNVIDASGLIRNLRALAKS